jgi:CBS domain-containing protein/mannitol/fructose-specific phosphotransferase system IIA component (Ntr-type)
MMTLLLTELLPAEHIVVPLDAGSFRDAIGLLVRRLHQAGAIRDLAALERTLTHTRNRDVVAITDDVALPHFRTDAVDHLVLALGISASPLDPAGSSLSTAPRIIALVLAPPEAATRYLQTVAALARLFREPNVVERMTSARNAQDVLVLPELRQTRIQPDLRVRDVMTLRTEGIAGSATVRDAIDLMLKRGWRALPVLGEKGDVQGIISEWDVMRALLPEIPTAGTPRPASARPILVREAMTRSVLCVPEDLGLEEAAHMMLNKNVEHVPVVNESVLTGMLSRGDIIKKLFAR